MEKVYMEFLKTYFESVRSFNKANKILVGITIRNNYLKIITACK